LDGGELAIVNFKVFFYLRVISAREVCPTARQIGRPAQVAEVKVDG